MDCYYYRRNIHDSMTVGHTSYANQIFRISVDSDSTSSSFPCTQWSLKQDTATVRSSRHHDIYWERPQFKWTSGRYVLYRTSSDNPQDYSIISDEFIYRHHDVPGEAFYVLKRMMITVTFNVKRKQIWTALRRTFSMSTGKWIDQESLHTTQEIITVLPFLATFLLLLTNWFVHWQKLKKSKKYRRSCLRNKK